MKQWTEEEPLNIINIDDQGYDGQDASMQGQIINTQRESLKMKSQDKIVYNSQSCKSSIQSLMMQGGISTSKKTVLNMPKID